MVLRDERGAITLEACVSVFAFLILMLFLTSVFVMFMAQNATAHAALQASQSLSLDAFAAEEIGTGGTASVKEAVVSLGTFVGNLFGTPDDRASFATNEKWFENGEELPKTLKKRFVGYLAGGDETRAEELCELYQIKDGLDGLDFSESRIEDDTLYIVLRYEFENDYEFWNVNPVHVEQTTCSVLWKTKG